MAFASPSTTTKNTGYAGYGILTASSSMKVTTTFVVPKLKCGKGLKAIAPGAYIETTSAQSIAALLVGCHKGKASYFPVFSLNGNSKAYQHLAAHAGDKVVVTASENATSTKLSVVDKTHKSVRKTVKGSGTTPVSHPFVGDIPVYQGSKELGVPKFGRISFSASKLNGKAFGSYSNLIRVNRYNSTLTTLEIKTTKFASNKESFKTIFKHS